MEPLVHNVKDLAPETRQCFEAVLGERLHDNQHIYLVVVTPGVEPSDEKRAAAIADLEQLSRQGTAHRESLGASAEEADAALDQAIQHVRSGKDRP